MEYYGSPFFNGDPIFHLNNYHNLSGAAMVETQQQMYVPQAIDKTTVDNEVNINGQEKKKKMTNEQVKLLEISFEEEIKLDPIRKMKLAKELGLHPRQVAVWFQNKKARWKNKQVEHLYESLRQEFDVVCKEKEMLQQELMRLKSMVNESGSSKMMQTWRSCSQIDTLGNTSVGSGSGSTRS